MYLISKRENESKMATPKKQSQGIQCVSYGCFSREYEIINSERRRTGISFFYFLLNDKGKLQNWCALIRRQNNRNGFTVGKHTKICEKHFEKEFIYRPPGGTRVHLLEGAKPVLHLWNEFSLKPTRKPPVFEHLQEKRLG